MNEFRARLDRFHGVQKRLGLVIFDFDQIHRLFGDIFAVRGHRRDFFTDEPHLAVGQYRHIIKPPADFKSRAIRAGDNGAHAMQRARLAGVDTLDFSGSNRAAQQLTPKHTGQYDIDGVLCLSIGFQLAFDPGSGIANDLFRRCHLVPPKM